MTSSPYFSGREVMVAPFTDLLQASYGTFDHRGGPDWPEWEAQTFARHNRIGQPIDERPVSVAAADRLSGAFAWGGPISGHFGHQVVDFSMRLVATLDADPRAIVTFASHPRYGDWTCMDDTPVFGRQILDWLGLPRAQALFIARPTLVERLSVWPQAEQHHGPGPSEAHLARMDALVARRIPSGQGGAGVLYVSRARMHARLAAEHYIEQAMGDAGARVIRPETLPLREQLEAYVSADTAIFPEGSAVQAARLLGHSLGDVVIVQRRPGDRIAEDGLRPRSRSLSYLDALRGVVCGLGSDDEPAEVLGLPILDPNVLLDGLASVAPRLRAAWDPDAWGRSRDEDVMAWLDRTLDSPRVRGERSWRHILDTIEACGLGHLAATAASMMSERAQPPETKGPATTSGHRAADPEVAAVLMRVARSIGARRYLEIGVGTAQTLAEVVVPERVGVDPHVITADAVAHEPRVEIRAQISDDYFRHRPAEPRFDLVYLDGAIDYRQAYRDLLSALRCTHRQSVIALAGVWPRDERATYGTPEAILRSQPPVGNSGVPACGDRYKVALAIHDLHPDLAFGLVGTKRGPVLLMWRSTGAARVRRWGSFEAIDRVSYEAIAKERELLMPASLDATLQRIEQDLGPIAEGPAAG